MLIEDKIYGRIKIDEPVIAELINSAPMQRLKEISQDGAPHYIQSIRTTTRFEHSVGAWYLSHRYSRPIGEQIASLLHDIPHTAFSHVIDFVMHDENHEYHDRFTKQIILESDIPDILKRHNVDLKKVLNKENYYLLDNKLPDISVDRWDYFMRDGFTFGLLPEQTIELFLKSVKMRDEKFYFEDVRVAGTFAILFMNFSRLMWLDPTSHGSFFLVAGALKKGLQDGIITEQDIFKTDDFVMDKLKAAHDPLIDSLLDRLQPGKDFSYAPEAEAEFFGPNKPRFVDPLVETGDGLKRLSELVPGMREYFEEFSTKYKYLGVVQAT
jgi:HD superfamily phosphohydrolase